MDIYIKPAKKIALSGEKHETIYIKDIAEVIAPSDIAEKIKMLRIIKPDKKKNKSYLVSVTDIIKAIDLAVPDSTINNVGEIDTVVEYSPKAAKENAFWKWMKIAFVSLVLLAGSATAIMSFHTDAQIPTIFKNFYYIFFNEKVDNPLIIELPYSIGVAVGIIVFFNHFAGKKLTSDPTPIEVELSVYEADVTDTMIDVLNTKQNKKGESK